MTKFHFLIVFTSQYIQQYAYYNCLPGCDVINFGINVIFLIKPFRYMTKTLRQDLKYLENEKSF